MTAVQVRRESRAPLPVQRGHSIDPDPSPDHQRRRVGRAVIDPEARGHIVVTPNIQHIALLERDPAFQAAYADASLTLADGWPVARAANTSRVPGSDLFGLVCAEAASRGLTIGIVGGRPGAAGRAVDRLQAEHPTLVVAVVDVPAYGFEHSPEQTAYVVDRVSEARPDILFVALGAPKQEVFAHAHRDELNAGVILCVGAAVDFYAGDVARAPEVLQHAGLEWAHRIVQEPGRLAGRYAQAAPAFVGAVVRQRVGIGRLTQARPVKPLTAAAEAKRYAGAPWLRSYARLAVGLDAVTLVGATLLASWLRFGTTADQQPVPYTLVALVVSALWVATLAASRAYEKRFLGTGPEEFRRVFHASLYAAAIVGFGSFAVKLDLARGFLLLAQAFGIVALLVERSIVRAGVRQRRRRGAWAHRVVVVGDARDAAEFLMLVRRDQHTGFNVVGLVLDNNRRRRPRSDDLPVYDDISKVHLAIEELAADTVAVTGFGPKSREAMRELTWSLEGTGVELVVAPAFSDISGARISVRPVSGVPLLHLEQPELSGGRRLLKATVERVLALVGLLLVLPFAIVAALVVKLDSRGPVFFRQERVGRVGTHFTLYKLRTMHVDAEHRQADLAHLNEADGPLFKLREDPRVTRVGQFLRKWSLDELPQLWNVLRGDMALVGPRPPVPAEVEQYGPDATRRLLVKPGLTGLWQVNGRADLAWVDAVRLDLYYVENWSLALDLTILGKTIWAVLKRNGAY